MFLVSLEKKGRKRSVFSTRNWAYRTFKLKGQILQYYKGHILKGSINIANSKCISISPSEANGKRFPFAIYLENEVLVMSALSSDLQSRCVHIFNLAAANPNWILPEEQPSTSLIPMAAAEVENVEKVETHISEGEMIQQILQNTDPNVAIVIKPAETKMDTNKEFPFFYLFILILFLGLLWQ